MARSPAEIQADIALTRRLIERELDELQRRVPRRWWTPYAVFGGALVIGLVMSRVPLFRLIGAGGRAVRTGLAVAGAVAAVDRFAAWRRPAA
jgi:uncharacterized protein DUF3618